MEITSRENPQVREYVRLRENRSFRRKTGRLVIEGVRLLSDALESGVRLQTVFLTEQCKEKNEILWGKILSLGVQIYIVGEGVAQKLADTSTPQGVFAVAFMLDKAIALDKINLYGAYAALENIRDPGNMGTILRTAEALGFAGVIFSAGCTDVYAPKVVRASMGAVFRIKLFEVSDLPAALVFLKKKGMQAIAALASGTSTLITQLDLKDGVVAAIGNEGEGLSAACVEVCTPFTIPMRGRAESLNAAAATAIIMWEIMRGQ